MKPDFGHKSAIAGGAFLDAWGDGPLMLRHAGKKWLFEFSEMFGPLLLTASGEASLRQPISEDHPFWAGFNLWSSSGRRCRAVRSKSKKLRFYLCHIPKGDPA